jgi:phospholipase/carboxylesterase
MTLKPILHEYDRPAYMTGLAHRVWQPHRPPPVPTVVMLHGRYGTEDVTWVFAPAMPENWLLLAPRAILPENEPGNPADGYSWLNMPYGRWPRLDEFDDAVTALADFLRALPDVYGADPQQIYLLGFSQGAATAFALAMRHPKLVQGVMGLVGFAPELPEDTAVSLANLPLFLAVGQKDERVPLSLAQASAQRLRQVGADLTYNEYPVGHRLNSAGIRDLTEWMTRTVAAKVR